MHLIASLITISTLMGCSEKENIRSANSSQNSSAEPTTTLAPATGTTTVAPVDATGTFAPTEQTTMVATFGKTEVRTVAPADTTGTIAPTEQTTRVATFGMLGGHAIIFVPLGGSFSIRMETGLPGYDWHLEGTLPVCLLETRREDVDSTTDMRIFEYSISEPCAEMLQFRYKRASVADEESDPRITVRLSVQDARAVLSHSAVALMPVVGSQWRLANLWQLPPRYQLEPRYRWLLSPRYQSG